MNIPVATPVINWRNAVNKKGLYPIHLRIYIHPHPSRYYPIKVPQKAGLEHWTGKEGAWVKNTHPYAFEINNRISELKAKITELTKRFYNQSRPINFYAIERELLRKGDRAIGERLLSKLHQATSGNRQPRSGHLGEVQCLPAAPG